MSSSSLVQPLLSLSPALPESPILPRPAHRMPEDVNASMRDLVAVVGRLIEAIETQTRVMEESTSAYASTTSFSSFGNFQNGNQDNVNGYDV